MSTLLNRVRSHLRNLEATAWNAEGLAGAVKIILHEELPRGEFANRERLLALVLLAGTYSDKAVIDVVMRLLGWKDQECQELRSEIEEVTADKDNSQIEAGKGKVTADYLKIAENDVERLTGNLRSIGQQAEKLKPNEIRRIVSGAIGGEIIAMPHGDCDTWMQCYGGGQFWPLDPRQEDIRIEDIAHHLALINRYTGATIEPYSVAQHSVLVSDNVHRNDALSALLHDASEAYLADVARPVKHSPEFKAYREAEERLMRCVAEKFGLSWPEPESVKSADMVLLATERRDLMGKPPIPWKSVECIQPLITKIVPWEWREAERRFLDRFCELTQMD